MLYLPAHREGAELFNLCPLFDSNAAVSSYLLPLNHDLDEEPLAKWQ
jgi:hypothetical protein